jgi:hypothetical protein
MSIEWCLQNQALERALGWGLEKFGRGTQAWIREQRNLDFSFLSIGGRKKMV